MHREKPIQRKNTKKRNQYKERTVYKREKPMQRKNSIQKSETNAKKNQF